MCMCATALLKAKKVKAFAIFFFSLFGVLFWVKSDILFKITCVSFTLIILQ